MIIDAHVHLWKKQDGRVGGKPVFSVGNGKSDFGGEIRQMLPPYMLNGENTADMLISNMDLAGVSGAVAVQEYIDGNQDGYLLKAKKECGGRLKVCSLYEDGKPFAPDALFADGFDGVKICAGRLENPDLTAIHHVFEAADRCGRFVAIDLADGALQTDALKEIATSLPSLRIAIGHFGMVTRENWQSQIKLARLPNVYIESGGITWLFNGEFYPYPSAVKAIKEAMDICGIEKLMWGSDYPRTMTAITYKMSYDFVLRSDELTDRERSLFLGENATQFYRFSDLAIPPYIKTMVDN